MSIHIASIPDLQKCQGHPKAACACPDFQKVVYVVFKDQRNNWVRTRENVSGFTIATYRFVVGEEKDWVQITKTEFSEK